MPETLAVSRPEAAKLLGISLPTLDRRLRDGELPSVLVGGRRLIPRGAIDDALQTTLEDLLGGPDEPVVFYPNPEFQPGDLAAFASVPGLRERMQFAADWLADRHGDTPVHNSRPAVAIHEASHAVITHLEGRTVSGANIGRRDDGGWHGSVACSDVISPDNVSAAFGRSMVRQVIAGVVGEQLFIGPNPASEIREQILFGICCNDIAAMEGVPVADVIAETLQHVREQLEANVEVVFAIAAALEAQGALEQSDLADLLEGARHA